MTVHVFATPPRITFTRQDVHYPFSRDEQDAIEKLLPMVKKTREGDGLKLSANTIAVGKDSVLVQVSQIRYSQLLGLWEANRPDKFSTRAKELGIKRITTNNAIITADGLILYSDKKGLIMPPVNGFVDAVDFRPTGSEDSNLAARSALRELREEYGIKPNGVELRTVGIFDDPTFGISIASIISVPLTMGKLVQLMKTAVDRYENPNIGYLPNTAAAINEFIGRNDGRIREILRFLLEQIREIRTF
ncbi:MAG: hypothetical protein WCT31_04745 [Candidatus Micrarchaeia archaeon]|jgi:hypothetical protein